MTAFEHKFTDSERAAVVDAMLGVHGDRMTPRDAVAAAARAELPDAGRFEMTASYARKLRARALAPRAKYTAAQLEDPDVRDAAIREAYGRVAHAILVEAVRVLRQAEVDGLDVSRARQLLRALRDARPRPELPRTGDQNEQHNETAHRERDAAAVIIAALTRMTQQHGHTGQNGHTPEDRDDDASEPAENDSDAASLPREVHIAARARANGAA